MLYFGFQKKMYSNLRPQVNFPLHFTSSTMVGKKLSKINWPLKERIGSTAGYVDDHLVVCGGYSPEDKAYSNMCQTQGGKFGFFFLETFKLLTFLEKS